MQSKTFIFLLLLVILVGAAVLYGTRDAKKPSVVENNDRMPLPPLCQEFFSPAKDVENNDRMPLPPLCQEFFSPAKDYVFVVSTSDNWESKKALGELFQVDRATRNRLWTRLLPHELGPRFVLVGRHGGVLMLDEWINISSPYTVMILNRQNDLIAQYDLADVERIMDVPGAELIRLGRYSWLSSPPALDASGETARVGAGGKVLLIRLADGYLSVAR